MKQRALSLVVGVVLLIGLCTCRPKDATVNAIGVAVSLRPLWQTAVNAGSHLAYGIEMPITFGNGVLCPGVISYPSKGPFGRAVLNFIDTDTGKIRWTWNDYMTDYENSYVRYAYQYGQYLVINGGPRNYCIDLSTGKTVWKRWMSDSLNARSCVTGIGNVYFVAASTKSEANRKGLEEVIYKGQVIGNEIEQRVVRPDVSGKYVSGNGWVGGASAPTPIIINTDTLLSIDYSESLLDWYTNSSTGLYNMTKKTWVYTKVPLASNNRRGPDRPSVYSRGNVYQAIGGLLTCHEVLTGKNLWEKNFSGDFSFSGFLIVDNLVVANCEDGYLYGLDPLTGTQVWKEKSSGSSTRLYYQNGVVYFAGGTWLHAVEVQTGKHLWKLQSPDLKRNSLAFYQGMVAGIAGQGANRGRIIASTGLTIYAYEAAK